MEGSGLENYIHQNNGKHAETHSESPEAYDHNCDQPFALINTQSTAQTALNTFYKHEAQNMKRGSAHAVTGH